HGVDPHHPLHEHASAGPAARGIVDVHRALDRMVGELVRSSGDAAVVAFTMGGMGPNHSDAQSMVLLPELLYRHAFGESLLTVPAAWTASPDRVPMLDENDSWDGSRVTWFPASVPRPVSAWAPRALARRLPTPIRAALKG